MKPSLLRLITISGSECEDEARVLDLTECPLPDLLDLKTLKRVLLEVELHKLALKLARNTASGRAQAHAGHLCDPDQSASIPLRRVERVKRRKRLARKSTAATWRRWTIALPTAPKCLAAPLPLTATQPPVRIRQVSVAVTAAAMRGAAAGLPLTRGGGHR